MDSWTRLTTYLWVAFFQKESPANCETSAGTFTQIIGFWWSEPRDPPYLPFPIIHNTSFDSGKYQGKKKKTDRGESHYCIWLWWKIWKKIPNNENWLQIWRLSQTLYFKWFELEKKYGEILKSFKHVSSFPWYFPMLKWSLMGSIEMWKRLFWCSFFHFWGGAQDIPKSECLISCSSCHCASI